MRKLRIHRSAMEDDLLQAGMIGIHEAIESFAAESGVSFLAYALIRIRGAILDELRRNDKYSRLLRKKAAAENRAISALENKTLRAARSNDVAAAMGMQPDEYDRLRVALASQHGDDDSALEHCPSNDLSPLQLMEHQEMAAALASAIKQLPARERQVIHLLYEQELDRRQAAQDMGVSESRISQIHAAAIESLRSLLTQPPLKPIIDDNESVMYIMVPRHDSIHLEPGAYAVRAGLGVLMYDTTSVAVAQPGAVLDCTGAESLRCVHALRLERCHEPVDIKTVYNRMHWLSRPVGERIADTAYLAATWKLKAADMALVIGSTRETVSRSKHSRRSRNVVG